MTNPYELRYSIYQGAQSRLVDKFNIDHHMWQEFHYWKREQELEGNKITVVPPIAEPPEFPTHEQVLVEAEKIYSFVQQSN